MIAAADPKHRLRLRGWLPLIVAALVFTAIVCVIVPIRAESSSDFRDYWRSAHHFRETGEISSQLGVHNYLPFFTILMVPWSFLPLQVAIVVFSLLSMGLLALTVVMVETLLNDGLGPRPRRATLVAIGLMLAYFTSCAVLGALGLLLMFLVVATWFLFERGREWEAGAALGLAVLIKVLPVLLIVFFLLKRRWRVAGAAVAVCVVLGLGLPLLSLGYEEAVAQHEGFRDRAGEHSAWATITSDRPRKIYYKNNALPTILRRLLTRTNSTPDDKGSELYINLADLPRRTVFGIYVILIAVLLAASVAAALRRPVRRVDTLDDERALRAQYGVWCCLMLLAAPLLWIHYLPMAYWPLAVVSDAAERAQRARGRVCRWCATVMLVWLVAALLLAWPAARAAGAQWAALACLWGVVMMLAFCRPVANRSHG